MREKIRQARLRLLKMHFESGVGHIGGNLSCLDLLMCLHHRVMKAEDVFILSKGHSAGALYVTLWSLGRLREEDLARFHGEGSKLAGHPPPDWMPEIRFATGSLGHGLSLSAGIALAKRLKGEPGRVYCLLSDGEWNEGSTWEALIFISHQKLDNLTLIIDNNGLQGFGKTREVADLGSLAEKLRSFLPCVDVIDGHDPDSIENAFSGAPSGPRAIIANTRKGNGISFMENAMEWHYLPMSEEQYRQAVKEAER